MYSYLTLRLAVLYEFWEQHAIIRKIIRLFSLLVGVAEAAALRGMRSAFLFARQQMALRKMDFGELKRFQEEAINAAVRRRRSCMRALADLIGTRRLTELSFEALGAAGISAHRVSATVPLADLWELFQYFRYFGDFRVAQRLRAHALAALIREQDRVSFIHPKAVNAALEIGSEDRVLRFLRGKNASTVQPSYAREAAALAHALSGDGEAAARLWGVECGRQDAEYRDFIARRRIAVVGPAVPSSAIGAEIDAFDVIVRTNFRPDAELPPELFGSRTDVSYYNHLAWTTRRQSVLDAADSLLWTNLKGREDDLIFHTLHPVKTCRARVFHQADSLFFDGGPMAIQNVLFDLIRCSPRELKLFCTSFYSSESDYHHAYLSHRRDRVIDLAFCSGALRDHEPFSNFCFPQRLLGSSLITTDALGAAALGVRVEEYADLLQKKYGSWSKAESRLERGGNG